MLPLTGAVWSSPARYLIRFFANHGMLTVTNSPCWRTVSGGSRTYVARVAERLGDGVLIGTGVRSLNPHRVRAGRGRLPGCGTAFRQGRGGHPPRPGAATAG
ncbi:MAG TPA: hypothetical protein VMU66_03555 [Gaiellales bacterium]|nr:hypothetical protein [Gaiellales bacterium]